MKGPLNITVLSESLTPFSRLTDVTEADEWVAYRRFYQLEQDAQSEPILEQLQVRHIVGVVDHSVHNIVLQWFKLPDPDAPHCLLIHGYYDHSALWRHMIHYWLKRGYNVLLMDLPGHGLSGGPQVSIEDFEEYQIALQQVILAMQKHVGVQRCQVMAQSTGAAILSNYLLASVKNQIPPFFTQSILLAPLVKPLNWKRGQLAYFLISPFREYVMRDYSINSHDEQFLQFVRHDPLQSRRLSAKWVGSLRRWIPRFKQLPCSEQHVLIIQGDEDQTVDYPYNLLRMGEKFPNAQIEMIAGGRHHMMSETPYYRDQMTALIDRYIGYSKNG